MHQFLYVFVVSKFISGDIPWWANTSTGPAVAESGRPETEAEQSASAVGPVFKHSWGFGGSKFLETWNYLALNMIVQELHGTILGSVWTCNFLPWMIPGSNLQIEGEHDVRRWYFDILSPLRQKWFQAFSNHHLFALMYADCEWWTVETNFHLFHGNDRIGKTMDNFAISNVSHGGEFSDSWRLFHNFFHNYSHPPENSCLEDDSFPLKKRRSRISGSTFVHFRGSTFSHSKSVDF